MKEDEVITTCAGLRASIPDPLRDPGELECSHCRERCPREPPLLSGGLQARRRRPETQPKRVATTRVSSLRP